LISKTLAGIVALCLGGRVAVADEPIAGNPLIAIPAGPFVFGSDSGNENEHPQGLINGKAFAMNRTEISNAQYQRFVDETGHRSAFYSGHPLLGLKDRPVVGVSWDDAADFCAYYGLRLPSEQEYERAARGTAGSAFPWGDSPVDAGRANHGSDICCSGDDSDGYAITAPVDSFPAGASKDGILNLVGNVWEWMRDFYAPYEGNPPPGVAGKYRVLRGGAWNSDPGHLTTTYRLAYDPEFRFAANGGFRCVRD
jgi:formylglycine-generating enzyme required for sulfatase activity